MLYVERQLNKTIKQYSFLSSSITFMWKHFNIQCVMLKYGHFFGRYILNQS